MFKHSDNDEDLFFSTVNTSSKLASIFDTTMVPDTTISSSNTDLTYCAPKQPPPMQQMDKITPKKSAGSHVSLVKVVYGYKYVNSAYESLGKVGCALVEYPDTNQYNIILYKDKTNHIFNIKIHNNIVFTLQEDKYLTLLDEHKRNWSLLFESQNDLKEFYEKLETTDAKIVKADTKEKKVRISDINPCQVKDIEQPKIDLKQEMQEEKNENDIACKSKTDILTRMAKVGQLVGLPKHCQNADMTDSESEIDDKILSKVSKRLKNVTETTNLITSKPSFSNSPLHSKCIIMQQNQQINENVNTLLIENRSQNTETHMKLLKVENKIDQLFDKLRIDNSNDIGAEIQKLQLQNEQLKLELQKLQFNKLLSESQKNLFEKKDIGIQSNTNLICDDNLNGINETNCEMKKLRENFETLSKEIENVEKRNRVQELKIKDLEIYYSQIEPLRKLHETDNELFTQSINEFTEENKNLQYKLKHLTECMQENMSTIDIYSRKIHQLEKHVQVDQNCNDKNDMKEIDMKLNEFNQYTAHIQQIADQLKETYKSIHYFEDKICQQDVKLNDIITNLQENYSQSAQNDTIKNSNNCSSSDIDISICSECLQSRTNFQKHKEELLNSESKINEFDKLHELDDETKRKIGDNLAPCIKEEMNTLFSDLQNILRDECRLEATSMIVKATYRIIHNINSTVSL